MYFCIVFASVTQSATTKLFNRSCPHSAVFNAVKSLSALLLFLVLSFFGFDFHLPTLLYGLSYGACLCLSMFSGYRALCLGPMALTSMLVSFSVILPLLYGVTVGNEQLTVFKYVAFFCLFLAILLTNADKLRAASEAPREKGNKRHALWLFYVALTFLCNGFCSILQKRHQSDYPTAFTTEFMLFAMLICSAVFLTVSLCRIPQYKGTPIRGKRYAILSGLANATTNLLTLILVGMEGASILFPILSAGTVLGALFCGRLIFGERLRANHVAALIFGVAAVILLKI